MYEESNALALQYKNLAHFISWLVVKKACKLGLISRRSKWQWAEELFGAAFTGVLLATRSSKFDPNKASFLTYVHKAALRSAVREFCRVYQPMGPRFQTLTLEDVEKHQRLQRGCVEYAAIQPKRAGDDQSVARDEVQKVVEWLTPRTTPRDLKLWQRYHTDNVTQEALAVELGISKQRVQELIVRVDRKLQKYYVKDRYGETTGPVSR